jgi:DMSO reductase anchor subunit
MRPDFSVLFLTTLIGAGQGLFLALVAAQAGVLFRLLPAPQHPAAFFAAGAAIAFAATALGLVSSFFHLGRPERGWRAIARWRTSWLSREVIVLPAFLGIVALYGLVHASPWDTPIAQLHSGVALAPSLLVGALGAVLAVALYVCTAMIYACLRFLPEWHSPYTVANFVLLGTGSGATLASAYAAYAAPALVPFFAWSALALTLAGLASRGASLVRNARIVPRSTLQTAIGIKHPRIVQTSAGFERHSFNTREFFHRAAPGALVAVKWSFLAAAFVIPAILLAAGLRLEAGAALVAAFVVQYAGLLAERWYFFAEARHPQNLYYGAAA